MLKEKKKKKKGLQQSASEFVKKQNVMVFTLDQKMTRTTKKKKIGCLFMSDSKTANCKVKSYFQELNDLRIGGKLLLWLLRLVSNRQLTSFNTCFQAKLAATSENGFRHGVMSSSLVRKRFLPRTMHLVVVMKPIF